jgi:hypothetical protein
MAGQLEGNNTATPHAGSGIGKAVASAGAAENVQER